MTPYPYSQTSLQLVSPEGEPIASQAAILTHAASVVHNLGLMRESALRVCISLYSCRELFVATGDEGWEAFCARNFEKLGLSQSNIRAAIRAGRGLTKYISAAQSRDEVVDMSHFETMSRSALILLGDADESYRDALVTKVIEISATTGTAPTSREIKEEIDKLKLEKADSDDQLRAIEAKLLSKEETINRLNTLVRDRESEISVLNEKLEDSVPAANSSQVVVEEADPNSKRIRLEIEAATASLEEAKKELANTKDQLEKEKSALERANRETARKQVAVDSINELEKLLETLKARWSESMVQKIRQVDPHTYSPNFSRIATDLRVLADQMDPQLV